MLNNLPAKLRILQLPKSVLLLSSSGLLGVMPLPPYLLAVRSFLPRWPRTIVFFWERVRSMMHIVEAGNVAGKEATGCYGCRQLLVSRQLCLGGPRSPIQSDKVVLWE